jgi:hypothetical protein
MIYWPLGLIVRYTDEYVGWGDSRSADAKLGETWGNMATMEKPFIAVHGKPPQEAVTRVQR